MKRKQNHSFATAIKHWKYLAPIVHMPQNEDDYTTLSAFLDELLDEVGDDEQHALIGLIEVISYMINVYDKREQQHIVCSGVEALKFLMQQHGLKQADLTDIASQGVLSEILNGKRRLNLRQIKQLAKKFNVSYDTFIDET